MIRWGVIGCGWVAKDFVIPAIQMASNARMIGVYDHDRNSAEGLPWFSLDELLAGDSDAIYIGTPNRSHAELTVRSAHAAKHVLCEKPMATNLADAKRMVEACRAAGVTYATAFDQRFHDAHQEIHSLVANGRLGTITSARIHYACWLPPEWSADNWRIDPVRAGGGAFIDLAPHGIDLLQYLLGEPITTLQCLKQQKIFDYPVDDGADAIGKTKSGCLVSLQVAYNCQDAFPRRTLELIGTDAMLIARNTMGQTAGGSLELIDTAGDSRAIEFNRDRSPFLNQIEAFSDCLLQRAAFPFSADGDLHTMGLVAGCL